MPLLNLNPAVGTDATRRNLDLLPDYLLLITVYCNQLAYGVALLAFRHVTAGKLVIKLALLLPENKTSTETSIDTEN